MRIINFIKNHFLLKIQLQGERKKKKERANRGVGSSIQHLFDVTL